MAEASETLCLGHRVGAGKTTVGYEIHAQLSEAQVPHCLIDGDNLDMACPPPQEHGLAERNLAATWATYRAQGSARAAATSSGSVIV